MSKIKLPIVRKGIKDELRRRYGSVIIEKYEHPKKGANV
ncbi:hypothetical protein RUMGNA_03868 [Mediterraneibacter gnavus ATCC 29149]|uniref:Uncharacterized protein n=1 Tax=Mediterraneibacter gnavus (strain ATCC 29149 / DSM 114966 / JCM 6515 / VPI C7-9) TaxID=411470 RepID=A7B8E6_MEDG7|nr:hypothetical protein RUMGNA_03868 [Mediterraneibacter gnavus ATCC 29149]